MFSRTQSQYALSSQANIGGYRVVIEAPEKFRHFFVGQMTAVGKVPPVTVLFLGTGVADLAAIQTAKNMLVWLVPYLLAKHFRAHNLLNYTPEIYGNPQVHT